MLGVVRERTGVVSDSAVEVMAVLVAVELAAREEEEEEGGGGG